MDLLLIRHAQTHSNLTRALDTAVPGADLTDLGREQVARLAEDLREEPLEGIWSSPTTRARLTAAALAEPRGLVVQEREGLKEIGAGDHEMSVVEEHGSLYRQMVLDWLAGRLDRQLPGGEDGLAALGRFDAVVEEVVASGVDHAAVVAHGAILRAWCGARAAQLPAELPREHLLPNTGRVRLVGDGSQWTATRWDDVVLAPGAP
ncbi:histidine phosphatase family protein [Nocardioides mangrovicus]|uniref:histidine phosphatase family protein n=1 Tax=Nocardioides mangrovicus TaxID=2478913 RepID=UPI00131443E0|nr:histidine phosphatase family protein [Nocardioides mangrovicus]